MFFFARNPEERVLTFLQSVHWRTLSPLTLKLTGILGCPKIYHLSSFRTTQRSFHHWQLRKIIDIHFIRITCFNCMLGHLFTKKVLTHMQCSCVPRPHFLHPPESEEYGYYSIGWRETTLHVCKQGSFLPGHSARPYRLSACVREYNPGERES